MKKFTALALAALGAAAAVYFYHAPLLRAYAGFFTVHTARRGADALVVLSGNIETRLPLAVDLYRRGYAPRILVTQPKPISAVDEKIRLNAWRTRAVLELLEAPCELETVPSLKGGVTSTFDEAHDLRDWAQKHACRRLIIITDDFHTRRALHAFKKAFRGTGIAVEAAGAPNTIFSEADWWRSDMGISTYVLEGVKYVVYLFSSRNTPGLKNL